MEPGFDSPLRLTFPFKRKADPLVHTSPTAKTPQGLCQNIHPIQVGHSTEEEEEKFWFCGHCFVTLLCTINATLKRFTTDAAHLNPECILVDGDSVALTLSAL